MSNMGDIESVISDKAVDAAATQHGQFDPLPPAWYPVMIEKAEVKTTNAGDGKYLHLQVNVLGDTHNGRKLFGNITLANANAKAVEIGARDVSALRSACGLLRLPDSTVLIDKVIQVKVVIVTNKMTNEPNNDIKGYKATGETTTRTRTATNPTAKPATATKPATTAKPATGLMPWERKPATPPTANDKPPF